MLSKLIFQKQQLETVDDLEDISSKVLFCSLLINTYQGLNQNVLILRVKENCVKSIRESIFKANQLIEQKGLIIADEMRKVFFEEISYCVSADNKTIIREQPCFSLLPRKKKVSLEFTLNQQRMIARRLCEAPGKAYITIFVSTLSRADSCVLIANEVLSEAEKLAFRLMFLKSIFEIHKSDFLEKSIKTAIGSIMSRNGSHNIGSHVLAALSHNVGTMPDDRVLYQYIQHRMDYIATATTEFPVWRQPMMFLGSIMKTFFSQRHLLDNIAASEGLRAWKFQGRNANKKDNVATIKIRIFKIDGTKQKELLDYETMGGGMCLDEDVSLAITGGTVGQHAFFTILENIIRNAAKHDWSSPPRKTRKNKFTRGKITGNLEISILFKDIPEEGNVEFTIFSNMSNADDKEDGKNTLFKRLEQAIDRPFIDDDGKLRSENWGIAEMKISAGYLQGRDPGVIGGLKATNLKTMDDERKFGPKIIEPVMVPDDCINHLGYRFKIPKSRTLLIIVNNKNDFLTLDIEKQKELARFGIYIKDKEEAGRSDADNSFEFVLMDSFPKNRLNWQLPFRIVCMDENNNCERTKTHIAIWSFKDDTKVQPKTVSDIVFNLLNCDNIETDAYKLIEHVAALWILYLKKLRGITTPLNLQISTELANDIHSGQSLVNAVAVVRFVIEEGMTKAIESFKKLYKIWPNIFNTSLTKSIESSKKLYNIWQRMKKTSSKDNNGIISDDGGKFLVWKEFLIKEFSSSNERNFSKEWKETIRAITLLEQACKEGIDASLSQSDADIKDLLISQIYLWLLNQDNSKIPNVWSFITEYKKNKFMVDKVFAGHPFKAFVDYLVEVCKQAKGYLGQYAEEISTLPKGFSFGDGQTEMSGKKGVKITSEEWSDADIRVNVDDGSDPSGYTIKYHRHYTPQTGCLDSKIQPPIFVTTPFQRKNDLYIEPLSGTQSYLTQLRSLSDIDSNLGKKVSRRLLQTKLVECGLLRVLIIDERVSRFINTHSNLTLATFALMNISVADDKAVTDALEESKKKHKPPCSSSKPTGQIKYTPKGLIQLDSEGIEMLRVALISNDGEKIDNLERTYHSFQEKYDILIVHQGIIDKWFNGVANDKNKMLTLYSSLKKIFQYVIITTGRGTPANIPDRARVLPFSTIETSLFRKYPEKLILVDAIMNILPINRQ